MTIDKFTVIRSKWGQGRLLTNDGKMCCLGFLSKACGYSDKDLGTRSFPNSYWDRIPDKFRYAATAAYHARLATVAAQINDLDAPLAEKEAKLITLFAKNGITLTFED